MEPDSPLDPAAPDPKQPIPEGKQWNKFKIVTKLGMHYDVLYPGEMNDLMMSVRGMGWFMNPLIYIALENISHILFGGPALPEAQEGDGGTVTPLRPLS